MRKGQNASRQELHLADQVITYRIYKNPKIDNDKKLVLLHGAGVAGEDTWGLIASMLTQWQEILVPDQRGMGDTYYPDRCEYPFSAQVLVADLNALVDHLGWWEFDLGGYSLGGMVCMLFKQQHSERVKKQFLLESALLDRPCWNSTLQLRQRYSEAANHLRSDNRDIGIRNFMDTISPNRRTSVQIDDLTASRLGRRPLGFAYALDCVTEAINSIDRESLVAAQGDVTSLIGGLSVDLMHQYHRDMAEGLPNWHYFMVPGTDHSLPFQKPRQIARIMNEETLRFR
ncbi:alpha/beta fold hydrolase [Neptunomonas qingdaonensis]|uniref:Pimeloyl-ACP methyl ester carboxylesterase n=1 Tax=Neptunomonas qingdaonensis TaxID=1045558 RepID=A0A1I2UW30_9GAMM|nr:alpha/beta hydrolase [Neptunomonas qingdaonensis]SFG81230.1 Pimeloyl-ACP methyl ester carboxylesterase [Neptunomonas qingdaonensis]